MAIEESQEQGRLSGDQRRNRGYSWHFGCSLRSSGSLSLGRGRLSWREAYGGTRRRSAFTRGVEKGASPACTDRELGTRRAYGVKGRELLEQLDQPCNSCSFEAVPTLFPSFPPLSPPFFLPASSVLPPSLLLFFLRQSLAGLKLTYSSSSP